VINDLYFVIYDKYFNLARLIFILTDRKDD